MELNFIKNEATRYWECEFEATADFNLHIEGVPEGKVWIYQRTTASGEHAYIKEATPYPSLVDVYDFDFSALIYPKFVKVVCGTEPTYAEVVSNGEITELKYQEKSVEVTANGNTEVIPDAGFAGLTKVNVSVNVPQSGGGGDAPSGRNSLEYYSTTDFSLVGELIFLVSLLKLRSSSGNTVTIVSSAGFTDILDGRVSLLAFGIDMSLPVVLDNVATTPRKVFESMGVTDVTALGWTPITEEEFYNLNA